MIKKTLSIAIFSLLFIAGISAQRIAIIDINQVLESTSEYQDAQRALDQVAADWQQEIAQEYDKIKSMYNKYQAEQVLLSEDVRKQKENEIMEKERQVRELQKQRFGPEGDLFKKRQQLVTPVQDMIYGLIEEFADTRGYDLIFDKASSAGLIFAKPEFDKTEDILKKL